MKSDFFSSSLYSPLPFLIAAMFYKKALYCSCYWSMTRALFFVTSLGVPQSITLLNLLPSPPWASSLVVATEDFSILLKPRVPPTKGAGALAPFLWGIGANKFCLILSLSLYWAVIGGPGWLETLFAAVDYACESRLRLSSLSLGLFLMNDTSFTFVLEGLNLLASSSFLNANSLSSTSSALSCSIALWMISWMSPNFPLTQFCFKRIWARK